MKSRSIALTASLLLPALFAGSATAQVTVERQKLVASNGSAFDEFGVQLAIDGDTMLIAAEGDDSSRGSAYFFERQADGFWVETQQIFASNRGQDDEFGCSVALDGDWAAVGARLEDSVGSGSGSLYMFHRTGGTWNFTERLDSSDIAGGDFFGIQVAFDGDRMAVAATRDDDKGKNSGSVYVFERNGNSWLEVAKLLANDGQTVDQFGLALDVDGDTVVACSLFESNEKGAAYIFQRQGNGTWQQTQKLTGSGTGRESNFGFSCSLDGDRLIVGCRRPNANGSAFAFEYNGSSWVETDEFFASDGGRGDQFGLSCSLDGDLCIVGAQRSDPNGVRNAGQAYIFERRANGQWVENAIFRASDGRQADQMGWDVFISGPTVGVGAVWANPSGDNSGAVYTGEANFLASARGVSLGSGGSVDYLVDFGPAAAGEQYWVLGTFSGTTPGFDTGGDNVPLNYDLYTNLTIVQANSGTFGNSRGVLDGNGDATFTLTVPGGQDPALAGLEVFHAATTYTSGPVRFQRSSEAVGLTLEN